MRENVTTRVIFSLNFFTMVLLRWRENKEGTNTMKGGKIDMIQSRYFSCSHTYLVVDWSSVDLGWSGLGHLGDSVLLHRPLILQRASLGMFLRRWHRQKRARGIPQAPATRLGAGTQSLLSVKRRCVTRLRIKEGKSPLLL